MPIPAIIPAIIAAAGAIGGAGIQAASAKKNRISQEKQNAIDRRRAATAYQTAVSDMRAAGMNPITGQNPPQAASTPMPAPQSDMSGVGPVVQQGAQAVSQLVQDHEHFEQEKALDWYKDQSQTASNLSKDYQDQATEQLNKLSTMVGNVSQVESQRLKEAQNEYYKNVNEILQIDDTTQFTYAALEKFGVTVQSSTGDEAGHQDSRQRSETTELNFNVDLSKGISNSNTSSNSNTHQNNRSNSRKNRHTEGNSQGQGQTRQGVDTQSSSSSGSSNYNTWTNGVEESVSDATSIAQQAAEAVTGGVGGRVGGSTSSTTVSGHVDHENANNVRVTIRDNGTGHVTPTYIDGYALKQILNCAQFESMKKKVQDLQSTTKSVEFKSMSVDDYMIGVEQYSYLQSQAEQYGKYYNYLVNKPGEAMSDYRKFSQFYKKRGSGNLGAFKESGMEGYLTHVYHPNKMAYYDALGRRTNEIHDYELDKQDVEEASKLLDVNKETINDLGAEERKVLKQLLETRRELINAVGKAHRERLKKLVIP